MAKNIKASFLKKSLGFTLIELITAIGVMSVIAMIAIAALDPFTQYQKSTDTKKKSDLSQIQKALEVYYEDNNRYPEKADVGYFIKGSDNNPVYWGDSWTPYMNLLPRSPDYPTTTYVYFVDEATGGHTYYLYASLSRGDKDPQACNDGSACVSLGDLGISDDECGGICNFAVASSNVNP